MTYIKWVFMVLFVLASRGQAQDSKAFHIGLIMSVDWEGFSLDQDNLDAFNRLRESYPEIKIVHFISAAYFTKPGAVARDLRTKIKSVMRSNDEIGLHLHAYESLLNAAGVPFRDDVTFWGHSGSREINGDRGHDVSLSIFSVAELEKIIRTSLDLLNKNGFRGIRSFRAGGWIATPQVHEALARVGITNDSSAVPIEILANVTTPDQPIYQINRELWPDQTPYKDEPYQIQTSAGTITEFPNTFGLADYLGAGEAFDFFQNLIKANMGRRNYAYVHFGFHQETAARYLERVEGFLEQIKSYQSQYPEISIEPVTLNEIK